MSEVDKAARSVSGKTGDCVVVGPEYEASVRIQRG